MQKSLKLFLRIGVILFAASLNGAAQWDGSESSLAPALQLNPRTAAPSVPGVVCDMARSKKATVKRAEALGRVSMPDDCQGAPSLVMVVSPFLDHVGVQANFAKSNVSGAYSFILAIDQLKYDAQKQQAFWAGELVANCDPRRPKYSCVMQPGFGLEYRFVMESGTCRVLRLAVVKKG